MANPDRASAPLATLEQLRHLGESVLSSLDIAAVNLLCASGLRCAEDIDLDGLLGRLDEWAERVELETARQYYQFLDRPAEFYCSQGYFCVLAMITVLQKDLGVRYNPARVRDPEFQDPHCFDPDFSDSRDLFIHGIIDGPGGTCASMPVLYAAVGRRLGYPLKLVEAPGHLFVRWDDPEGTFNGIPERFNVEASGQGLTCSPDEHYRSWPVRWGQKEHEAGCYLKSLSPRDEIACFLVTRACCLEDNGRLAEAVQCVHWAAELAPDDIRYRSHAAMLARKREFQRAMELEALLEGNRMRREASAIGLHPGNPSTVGGRHPGVVNRDARDVGHGPSCQCLRCREDRGAALAACGGDFGHGPQCQCFACGQSRQIASPNDPFRSRDPFGMAGQPQRFP